MPTSAGHSASATAGKSSVQTRSEGSAALKRRVLGRLHGVLDVAHGLSCARGIARVRCRARRQLEESEQATHECWILDSHDTARPAATPARRPRRRAGTGRDIAIECTGIKSTNDAELAMG